MQLKHGWCHWTELNSSIKLTIFVFNFTARTSSNATIDSLDDFARYSDDGNRETEERVAGQL